MPKVGRNDPCPCGSGRKYKNCYMREDCPINTASPAPTNSTVVKTTAATAPSRSNKKKKKKKRRR
ncbi:MAG: SEC-C metal-binding domain-containing protein [Chloroflexota bacterium]